MAIKQKPIREKPYCLHRYFEGEMKSTAVLQAEDTLHGRKRWSRFAGQNGGLAKVNFGFDYAANFSSFACVA